MDQIAIGAYIKKIRENTKLSQTDIAKMCNTAPCYVSRIESGQRCKSVSRINAILECLGYELVIQKK